MLEISGKSRPWPIVSILVIAAIMLLTGAAVAWFTPLGFLVMGLAIVVIAVRVVEPLSVIMFWTLPYMVANLPTGAFTLKLPEAVAYIFASAAVLRAFLRRERWSMPPATAAALLFLAVCLISTAWEPAAPIPFLGAVRPTDRNSPAFRSMSEIIWMALSWLVVVAAYNVVGRSPELFRKCVKAHCLGGGLAAFISLAMFFLAFVGLHLHSGGAGRIRNLVTQSGDFFRLAGVAYEPLFLAFYLITVIPVTLAVLILRPTWLPRRWTAAALTAQSIAMLMTFSAGGLCGLAVAGALMAILFRKVELPKATVRRLATGAITFIVVGIVAAVVVGGILDLVQRTLNKVTHVSTSDRAGEFEAGIGEFERYPILGAGPGMSNYHFPQFNPTIQNEEEGGGVYEVNNIVLGTMGEVGLVGLIALAFTVIDCLRVLGTSILRRTPEKVPMLAALTASLIGCAIQGLSVGFNTLSLIYLTGLLSLTMVAYRAEHRVVDLTGEVAGIENYP